MSAAMQRALCSLVQLTLKCHMIGKFFYPLFRDKETDAQGIMLPKVTG